MDFHQTCNLLVRNRQEGTKMIFGAKDILMIGLAAFCLCQSADAFTIRVPPRCRSGEKRNDGCNRCVCYQRSWICIARGDCDVVFPPERNDLETSTTVPPGVNNLSTAKPDLASTVCKSFWDMARVYYDGCNQCRCYGIGKADCTQMTCSTTTASKRSRRDSPEELGLQSTLNPETFPTTMSPATRQATEQPGTHDTPKELGEQNWFPTTAGPGQFGYDECRPNDKYYDECNTCVCNSRGRWICTARDCDFSSGPTDKQETEGDGATFEELGIRTTTKTRPIQTTQAIDAESASEETGVSGSPVPESSDENLPTEAPGLFARVTPIPASEMCKTNEDNMKTYFDGCNMCRCIDIGQSVCTKKACPVIPVTSRPSTHPTTAAPEVAQPRTHDTPEELGLQDWFPTTAAPEPVEPRTHDTQEELGIQTTPKTKTTGAPGQFVRVTPIPASEMCKTNEDTMKTYFDGCNMCRCFDIGQSVCTKKACPVIPVTSRPSTYPTTAAPEVEQPRTHDTPEEFGLQDWFPTTAAPEPVQPITHDTPEELGIHTTPKTKTTAAPGQFVRVTPIPASQICKTYEDNMKTYFDGCNTCRCFDIGQSVCTKKACPVIPVTSRPSTHPTTAAPEVEQLRTHDTLEELGLQDWFPDWFPTTAAPEPVQPITHDTPEELGIHTTLRPETQPTTVTSESGDEPETTVISETTEKDEVSQSEEQVEHESESEGVSESPDDAHAASQSDEPAEPLGDSVMMMNDEHFEESLIPEARDDKRSAKRSGRFVRVKPIPASVACKKNEDDFKVYFNGCNLCMCYYIGHSYCRKKACPVIPARQQQLSSHLSDLCRGATDVGKQFKNGCNTCWCRHIGYALCTRRDCPNN